MESANLRYSPASDTNFFRDQRAISQIMDWLLLGRNSYLTILFLLHVCNSFRESTSQNCIVVFSDSRINVFADLWSASDEYALWKGATMETSILKDFASVKVHFAIAAPFRIPQECYQWQK